MKVAKCCIPAEEVGDFDRRAVSLPDLSQNGASEGPGADKEIYEGYAYKTPFPWQADDPVPEYDGVCEERRHEKHENETKHRRLVHMAKNSEGEPKVS